MLKPETQTETEIFKNSNYCFFSLIGSTVITTLLSLISAFHFNSSPISRCNRSTIDLGIVVTIDPLLFLILVLYTISMKFSIIFICYIFYFSYYINLSYLYFRNLSKHLNRSEHTRLYDRNLSCGGNTIFELCPHNSSFVWKGDVLSSLNYHENSSKEE